MRNKKTTSSSLRHRLALESEQQTPDSAGGYVRSWAHVAYVWAEITPIGGKERLFVEKIQAESTHRIRMRYRDDITPKNRLVFDNRIFSIRAIQNVGEMKDVLEIAVEEGVED